MPRNFGLVGTREQWLAGTHQQTYVDDLGRVALDWKRVTLDQPAADARCDDSGQSGGLAFDRACRLYRSIPAEGRIERLRWSPSQGRTQPGQAVDLFGERPDPVPGEFGAERSLPVSWQPAGLAVDRDDHLFVADRASRRIVVYDLTSARMVRRIETTPDVPVDVVAAGKRVYALIESGSALLEVNPHGLVRTIPIRTVLGGAARIAATPCGCRIAVLVRSGRRDAAVVLLERSTSKNEFTIDLPSGAGDRFLAAPCGRALELTDQEIVIGRGAGQSLLRYHLETRVPMPPLHALGYTGGIVRAPDQGIAFWASSELRRPFIEPVRFETAGQTTVMIDGGEFQRAWGRLFIDACLPRGATLGIGCRSSDESEPQTALPAVPQPGPVVERATGSEVPWINLRPRTHGERTFESSINAPPGRYLWLTLELRGNSRVSPAIRAVRAELPRHDLLRRLPRTFSREPASADFLQRFLSGFDGVLADLDARAALRHVLLDPCATPQELLPWLAGFVGLLLDERWSEPAKRRAIDQVHWLFRYRGTVAGLRRFLEIGLESPIILIEHFKLRGQGSTLLTSGGTTFTSSVLGGGFRTGGQIGTTTTSTPLGATTEQTIRTHAHRFTVIVQAALDPDRLGIAHWILELHRPAHTLYDICTADGGMRVGNGLHVGLSSVIGPTSGFVPLRLGPSEDGHWASTLGRGALLGRHSPGTRIDSTRVGLSTEVG